MAVSSTMLQLSETTVSMRRGGDDMARAPTFASELGRVGAVWEVSFVLCALRAFTLEAMRR